MTEVQQRIGADAWRDEGLTGTGRRIGVLDRGFGGLIAFEERTRANIRTAYNVDKALYDRSDTIHGTQVVEVLHGIAPTAEIHVCEYDSFDTFVRCIDWMIRIDVHIISHSAGVPALPLDGRGIWAQEVDRVASQGILWINAAGNFANGIHRDALTDRNNNRLHEFRGFAGDVEALGIEPISNGGEGVIMLSWGDHAGRPANAIDLDLQVIDSETGQVIDGSYQEQSGGSDHQALEFVRVDMSRPFAVQIIDTNGDGAGVDFTLFIEFVNLPGGSGNESIIAPADATGALTVTALQGFAVAPYASRGPLSTGDIKPDIAAPGEIQLADGSEFIGTSAAAPVIAGAAAVVWQAYPAFNAAEVRQFLLDHTQGGVNVSIGQGRLLLPLPNNPGEPTPTPTSTAPRADSTPTAPGRAFTLNANPGYLLTDACLSAGQMATVTTFGSVSVGDFIGNVGPDGTTTGFMGFPLGSTYNLVADYPHGAVMCRVEGESQWQLCGARATITASRDGCIELLLNDNDMGNNRGSFTVEIAN